MEAAAAGLAQIMGELLRHAPPNEAPVLAWPAICGPAVAGRTRALTFTAGVLRVEVADDGWRTQLGGLEHRYLREFELLLRKRSVQQIDFVLARAHCRIEAK